MVRIFAGCNFLIAAPTNERYHRLDISFDNFVVDGVCTSNENENESLINIVSKQTDLLISIVTRGFDDDVGSSLAVCQRCPHSVGIRSVLDDSVGFVDFQSLAIRSNPVRSTKPDCTASIACHFEVRRIHETSNHHRCTCTVRIDRSKLGRINRLHA